MREATGGYAAGLWALCIPSFLASGCMALLMRHMPPREVTATAGSE
jgi:hypothetical protein